jgi:hypothetical protein
MIGTARGDGSDTSQWIVYRADQPHLQCRVDIRVDGMPKLMRAVYPAVAPYAIRRLTPARCSGMLGYVVRPLKEPVVTVAFNYLRLLSRASTSVTKEG